MTAEQAKKLKPYFTTGTIGVIIVLLGLMFKGFSAYANACKVPTVEADVKCHEIRLVKLESKWESVESLLKKIDKQTRH